MEKSISNVQGLLTFLPKNDEHFCPQNLLSGGQSRNNFFDVFMKSDGFCFCIPFHDQSLLVSVAEKLMLQERTYFGFSYPPATPPDILGI